MEAWRKVWRDGVAPLLSTRGLRALQTALMRDDARLIQGNTTEPRFMQCVQDWPVGAACAVGFCLWQGDGLETVGEVDENFARVLFEADQRLGEPAGCRWFFNAVDDWQRDEMIRNLLPEVEYALAQRGVGAAPWSRSAGQTAGWRRLARTGRSPMQLGPDFARPQTAVEAAATWAVAPNWQDQRATIAAVHRRFGAMLGRTLDAALAKHADPGPGYGHTPAEFGEERQAKALAKAEPTAAELDRERQERERFEAVRDRVARRFGLLEPLTTHRRVTAEEMAEIRRELKLFEPAGESEIPA